ncbi:MAG: DNA-binding protein [Candidatus Poribacteria bacterium]|nr:DNA-binding protein [Candidatus Poribacteria bacterium]
MKILKTMSKKGFSPAEIAEMLGVSLATIYREIDRGKLQCVKVGVRRVITVWDLEAYLGKERARMLLEDESDIEPTQMAIMSEKERIATIKAARGMWAHLPGSVDDFIKEKQKDIKIENRNWKESEQ